MTVDCKSISNKNIISYKKLNVSIINNDSADYSDAEVRKLLVKAQKEKVTLQSDLKQNEWRLDDESQVTYL